MGLLFGEYFQNNHSNSITNSIEYPISGLGEPNIYHDSGCITRNGDFTWRVSDCEELVGEVNQTT